MNYIRILLLSDPERGTVRLFRWFLAVSCDLVASGTRPLVLHKKAVDDFVIHVHV